MVGDLKSLRMSISRDAQRLTCESIKIRKSFFTLHHESRCSRYLLLLCVLLLFLKAVNLFSCMSIVLFILFSFCFLFISNIHTCTALRKEDLKLLLAANVHLGAKNCDPQMQRYVWRRRKDGINIIHLGKTWEKLMLAARIIVAIENPEDVIVVSARQFGQRAVFKFAQHTGAQYVGGRYTPGTFTNQVQKKFVEPRLLLVTDPITDSQVNIPLFDTSAVAVPFC